MILRHRFLASILVGILVAAGAVAPASGASSQHVLSGFPLLRQQHSLTCESSAASMATRGTVVEGQIMNLLPRHPNPNFGFRGNPDGQQGTKLVDYGVYAGPVHDVLTQLGYRSDVISYGSDMQIRASIDMGRPVVAWITYNLQRATPRLDWADGIQFFLVPHEHAILIVGYDGSFVYANDPWNARYVRYAWKDFNRAWGYFGNMALAVEPCPDPQSVTGLHPINVTSSSITWTWQAAMNADHYRIKVIEHRGDGTAIVAFQGDQKAHRYLLSAVDGSSAYQVTVRSVSACGVVSTPQTLWTILPGYLLTPTPTGTEGAVTPSTPATSSPAPSPSVVSPPSSPPTPTPTRSAP